MTIRPAKVDRVTAAFGPSHISDLLPDWKLIPDEFKQFRGTPWNGVVCDWFYRGLKGAKWTPKEGIDEGEALAHIRACMSSWEPEHEHKEAGCAYLLSLWFDDVTYPGKGER